MFMLRIYNIKTNKTKIMSREISYTTRKTFNVPAEKIKRW